MPNVDDLDFKPFIMSYFLFGDERLTPLFYTLKNAPFVDYFDRKVKDSLALKSFAFCVRFLRVYMLCHHFRLVKLITHLILFFVLIIENESLSLFCIW